MKFRSPGAAASRSVLIVINSDHCVQCGTEEYIVHHFHTSHHNQLGVPLLLLFSQLASGGRASNICVFVIGLAIGEADVPVEVDKGSRSPVPSLDFLLHFFRVVNAFILIALKM